MYDGASHVRTSQEISNSYFRGGAVLRLAQVSLVRLSPSILRWDTFWYTDLLFAELVGLLNDVATPRGFSGYGFYKRLSVPLIRQFLGEEREHDDTGRYIYLHVVLPHGPYVWDSACKYDGMHYLAQSKGGLPVRLTECPAGL